MPQSLHTRREISLGILAGATAAVAGEGGPAAAAAASPAKPVAVPAQPAAFAMDPRRTALLVIDMQNDFGARGGMFDRAGIDISGIRAVVAPIERVIGAARRRAIPIVYLKMGFKADLSDAGPSDGPNLVKHRPLHVGAPMTAPDGRAGAILVRDTWGTDIVAELRPADGDIVLYKTRFSGFFKTDLHEILQRHGIRNLLVTGCTTSVCVESTVRDAMFRDYNCLVLKDCMAEPIGADASRSNHEASLLTMQVLFAWISDSAAVVQALANA